MYRSLADLSDRNLEHALQDLGPTVAYPPTPMLAARVRERLQGRPVPVPVPWWIALWQPRWAIALVLVIAVAVAAVLALSPEARTALADRLGLRGIAIWYVPAEPSANPESTPMPAPALSSLGLGRPMSLEQAQKAVSFTVLKPTLSGLGQPDEVYLSLSPVGGQVSFLYRARPGLLVGETGFSLLLSQFRGDLQQEPVVRKGLSPRARIEAVTVADGPGYWVDGEPHLFFLYRDPAGQPRQEESRLAGNVLLWEKGDLTLRLEGNLSKEAALRIAESVR